MKFSKNGYYKATPKTLRKLGDSLLAASTFITGYAFMEGYSTWAIVSLVIGVVGKFLTNFFSVEEKEEEDVKGDSEGTEN